MKKKKSLLLIERINYAMSFDRSIAFRLYDANKFMNANVWNNRWICGEKLYVFEQKPNDLMSFFFLK